MIIFRPNSRLSPLLQLSFFLSFKWTPNRKNTETHIEKSAASLPWPIEKVGANGQETDIAYLAAWFQSRRPVRRLIGGPATKDPGTKLSSLLYYFLPPTSPKERASRSTHQAWISTVLHHLWEAFSIPAHCPFIGFATLFFDSCFSFLIVIIPFEFRLFSFFCPPVEQE